MPGRLERKVFRLIDRNKRLLNVAGWACFAAVCADYAGFIALPDIVTIPAAIGGIITGTRYAVWETLVKPRFEKAVTDRTGGVDRG